MRARTALYFNDDGDADADFFRGGEARTQTEVSSAQLRAELRLLRTMGSGEFGVAFLARFRGKEWVIKLPRAQTDLSVLTPCTVDQALSVPLTPDERARVERQFAKECHNAECVLDAPLLRTQRRLTDLTDDEYAAVCAARLQWRSLRGYQHMHPVVHYDAELPLLMSLPAEDTIAALRVTVDATMARPPSEWFDVAWQLSEAVAFLRAHPRLAHIDIKPANVLFVRRAANAVHCWLSDYGDLFPVDDRTRFEGGTALYHPHALFQSRLMAAGATYGQRSLYAYYATLVDLLKVRVRSSGEATPDWYLTACLSEYGYNVGECVHNMWVDASGAPSEFDELTQFLMRRPDLMAHLVAPMQLTDDVFGRLDEHFDATRAWLAGAHHAAPSRRLSVFGRLMSQAPI